MQANLFDTQSENLRGKYEPLLGSWSSVLKYETLQRLNTTLKLVNDDSLSHVIYPDKRDVLRIFKQCSMNNIRVVVIGQDPYFNGNANGFAFGCKKSISPSLKQIINCLEESCVKTGIKKDIGLQYLVEQGVFLFNTVLTVRENSPLSHENIGWKQFTRDVIQAINTSNNHIVWMLWGSKAKDFKSLITNLEHKILVDVHPASASHHNTNWVSKNFTECNKFFEELNQPKINWV